jgi:hypothetical protein
MVDAVLRGCRFDGFGFGFGFGLGLGLGLGFGFGFGLGFGLGFSFGFDPCDEFSLLSPPPRCTIYGHDAVSGEDP